MEELENAPALFPRERLNLARMAVAAADPPRDEQLAFWLAAVPVPADLDDVEAVCFRASVTCDLHRLTWWADGKPDLFIPAMAHYFEAVGASAQEMERLTRIGRQLQPDRLGCWIMVAEELFDAGWFFPVNIPLRAACDLAPQNDANDTLRTWAAEHGLATCASLGHSIGEGNPFTALQIPLPAGSTEQQVYAGLKLFERMGVPSPPDMALGAILNQDGAKLAVSVWLLDDGLAKVGLLAAKPPSLMMLDICQTTTGFRHADNLAAFSGMLGPDHPAFVECEWSADGFEVELHYEVASSS